MAGRLRRVLRAWVERRFVGFARLVGRVEDVGGVTVVVIGPRARAVDALARAMEVLAQVGDEFPRIVQREIDLISVHSTIESIVPFGRAYVSPILGLERTNPLYLASRLVWVAAYLRTFHERPTLDWPGDLTAVEGAAFRAQLRFLEAAGAGPELMELMRAQDAAARSTAHPEPRSR